MRIAVIGLYYAPNLGDAVICDCVAEWMREEFPNADIDIVDIEGKREFPNQVGMPLQELKIRQIKSKIEYWLTEHRLIDVMYFWNKRDVDARQKYYDEVAGRRYDAAVFAGGQLFMDWLSMDVSEFIKRFDKVNTPVFLNACGTGKAASRHIRSILKENLSKSAVKFVSSRDDVDEINSLYMSGNMKAVRTFDPALWAGCVYGKSKKKSDLIGLGVMHCTSIPYDQVIDFWVSVIGELDQRKIRWKMFCNGAVEDYRLGQRVLEKLSVEDPERALKCAETPEELVEQISGFSGLISFRLHSHIIAASLGIPAVAIEWDKKLRFFYRNLEHEERCLTIESSAQEVADALVLAKKEECDRELIVRQRSYAKNMLLSEIKKVVFDE